MCKLRSYFGNEQKKIFLIIDVSEQINSNNKTNIVSSVLKYLYQDISPTDQVSVILYDKRIHSEVSQKLITRENWTIDAFNLYYNKFSDILKKMKKQQFRNIW